MKRFVISIVIAALFVYFLSKNFDIVTGTFSVISHVSPLFLVTAVLISVVSYYLISRASRSVFAIMGMDKSLTEMFKLQFASSAINIIVPTGGASIMYLYSEEAKKHDEPVAAAAAAYMVWILATYTSLSILLAIAMTYLLLTGHLTAFIYIPAAILFFALIIILLGMRLSSKQTTLLRKIFAFIIRLINRILSLFHKITLREELADELILEVQDARGKIRSNPRAFWTAILEILGSHLFYLIAAEVIFLSFGFHPLYRVLLAGYAAGALFTIVSPTPNGIGFAEVGMAAVYTTLGVDVHLAGVVAVISRMLTFWIPMLIGFLVLQRDNIKKLSLKTK